MSKHHIVSECGSNNIIANSGYGSADETSTLLVTLPNAAGSSAAGGSGTTVAGAATIAATVNNSVVISMMTMPSGSGGSGASATTSSSASSSSATTARMATLNSSNSTTGKPVLMRQDRTSTYLASPNLSQTIAGFSEESGHSNEDSSELLRASSSVTDLDIQYNRLETPVISISNVCQTSCDSSGSAAGASSGAGGANSGSSNTIAATGGGGPSSGRSFVSSSSTAAAAANATHSHHRGSISGYQLTPHNRCRACRSCERRASTTPVSTLYLARSASRESVRSTTATHHGYLAPSNLTNHLHTSHNSPHGSHQHQHQHAHHHHQLHLQQQHHQLHSAGGLHAGGSGTNLRLYGQQPPPVFITGSPVSGSRIIRQSSQPEASNITVCSCGMGLGGIGGGSGHSVCPHSQTAPSVSLRQLRDPSECGIAGIAADSLRINGAMRPFKQVREREKEFKWVFVKWA